MRELPAEQKILIFKGTVDDYMVERAFASNSN